jgi:hypothetical protein
MNAIYPLNLHPPNQNKMCSTCPSTAWVCFSLENATVVPPTGIHALLPQGLKLARPQVRNEPKDP